MNVFEVFHIGENGIKHLVEYVEAEEMGTTDGFIVLAIDGKISYVVPRNCGAKFHRSGNL